MVYGNLRITSAITIIVTPPASLRGGVKNAAKSEIPNTDPGII